MRAVVRCKAHWRAVARRAGTTCRPSEARADAGLGLVEDEVDGGRAVDTEDGDELNIRGTGRTSDEEDISRQHLKLTLNLTESFGQTLNDTLLL